MKSISFSHEDLVRLAQFSGDDLEQIKECRRSHTQLGFAYQLAFVRLYNRITAPATTGTKGRYLDLCECSARHSRHRHA